MALRKAAALSFTGTASVNKLKEKEDFRKCVDELIAQFRTPMRGQSCTGDESGPTLEHVTRRHFIDPFLRALGWDLSKLNEQMIEEARTKGETTLRLDYLGVNPQSRIPLLIVEAKAWAAPFVAPSARANSSAGPQVSQPTSLICSAIEHCKAGGKLKDSPVTLLWAEYLAKLHQYVTTLKNESGHVITRLATLSGQWLVTFYDPDAIFLSPKKVNPLLINIYRGDELITQAGIIFDQLARSSINDVLPEMIRPSLLPTYIRRTDIKRAYRALWVSRQTTGASWKPRPNIDFEVAMVVERKDGAMLTVIDDSLQGFSVPHDYNNMRKHIADIETQSKELLQRVNSELGSVLQPSGVETFPGFPEHRLIGNQNATLTSNRPRMDLVKMVGRPGEFLFITGTAKHFLYETPKVNPCICHDWVQCQKLSQEHGERPIFSRSVEPKAFFTTGEKHHCAHRLFHDRRNARCQIDAFEEFLCCRTCTLQNYCWQPQELASLPCGAVGS